MNGIKGDEPSKERDRRVAREAAAMIQPSRLSPLEILARGTLVPSSSS